MSEVKASTIGWGAYIAALTGYCLLHQAIVSASPPDLPGSAAWAVREWGIWLFITPLAFRSLRRYERGGRKQRATLVPLCGLVLLTAIAFRAADGYLTQGQDIASTTVIYLPRYIAALAGIVLIWHLILRTRSPSDEAAGKQESGALRRRFPETLLVSKGNDQCPIRVERIAYIVAAGNYVDIQSDGKLYLMRSTMKQMQEQLPPSMFVRIHRSHIVNLGFIDRIKAHPSGNGVVLLRGGKTLNISKKYMEELRRYRFRSG